MTVDYDVVTVGGITLTGLWSNGATVRTLTLGGWSGSPGSSLSLAQKTRAPGAWPSPRQLKERILTPAGHVSAPNRDVLRDTLDVMDAAASIDPETFTVTEGSLTRSLTVLRQDELVATVESSMLASWSMQLVAPDPRRLGTPLTTSTGLPSVVGGFTIPYTIPFTIPSTVVSGQCFLTNPGNTTGPLTLQIHGPVTAPIVTHVASGLQLMFSSSLTLSSGEWLDIDMEAQTVLLRGQASRSGYVTQRGWFGFDPGANTFAFAATTGTGTLTVTGTPAWL